MFYVLKSSAYSQGQNVLEVMGLIRQEEAVPPTYTAFGGSLTDHKWIFAPMYMLQGDLWQ